MDSATHNMRIALHGRRTGGRDPDWEAAGAFYTRATTMGWLATADSGGGRLWDTSDAEDDPEEGIIASYEVSLGHRLPTHEPLSIIPFMACAFDATHRLGKVCLDGADITLPLHAMRKPESSSFPRQHAVASLLATAQWYERPSSTEKVPVVYRLAMSDSSDQSDITPWLLELQQEVAEFIPDPAPHRLAAGEQSAAGTCALVEWSAELIGWTAAVFAEAARQNCASESATLTIYRAPHEGRSMTRTSL
ncbi:hypothetical protein [Streptomyces botrytidirepellens]|uniref:hypothetical protein n=1 Tax=Streptomyces botrytidirepellens TaxID=2486417 RepID=UPI0011CDE1CB|nr:hypothetical protein [Streptomyces botrytidirepellens]